MGPDLCLWAGIPPCTCLRGVLTFTGQFPFFLCFPPSAGFRPLRPHMVFRKRAQSRFTLPKKEKFLSLALFHCCLVYLLTLSLLSGFRSVLFFCCGSRHLVTSLLGSAFSSPLSVLIGHLDLLISALSPRE